MKRKPRDCKELQKAFPWYRPAAYSGAASLKAGDWWNLLAYRKMALEGKFAYAQVSFESIKKDPLGRHLFPLTDHPIKEISFQEWRRIDAIHRTPAIAKRVDRWLEKYGHLLGSRYLLGLAFSWFPRPLSVHSLLIKHLEKPSRRKSRLLDGLDVGVLLGSTTISVDLTVSDEILRSMFNSWLADKRMTMSRANCAIGPVPVARKAKGHEKFTEYDFDSWVRTRVLEFLDILIACRAQQMAPPTDEELAYLLLDTYARRKGDKESHEKLPDVVDVIRKQTKKHAALLLRSSILNCLAQEDVADFFANDFLENSSNETK